MTDTSAKNEATPFWHFSLHFYRQAGVADACLAMQDGCGVDVNLLLFLLWRAAAGQLLSAEEVKKLDEQVRDWRNLAIGPLREARRRLKNAPTLVEPTKQEAFRTKVKAIELEAERLQQEALYAFTRSEPPSAPAASAAPAAAARANIAAYERAMGASFPKNAVAVLLGAFGRIALQGR